MLLKDKILLHKHNPNSALKKVAALEGHQSPSRVSSSETALPFATLTAPILFHSTPQHIDSVSRFFPFPAYYCQSETDLPEAEFIV